MTHLYSHLSPLLSTVIVGQYLTVLWKLIFHSLSRVILFKVIKMMIPDNMFPFVLY